MPASSANEALCEAPSRLATPSTRTLSPATSASCWTSGSSSRHGPHQLAQRLSTVGTPGARLRSSVPPPKQSNTVAGRSLSAAGPRGGAGPGGGGGAVSGGPAGRVGARGEVGVQLVEVAAGRGRRCVVLGLPGGATGEQRDEHEGERRQGAGCAAHSVSEAAGVLTSLPATSGSSGPMP